MKTSKPKNTISRSAFLRALALTAPLFSASALFGETRPRNDENDAIPDQGNFRTFVELARSDIRRQKAFIIAQNLPLTEAEAVDFWPEHREYEEELGGLLDERYEGILQFAREYGSMSDEQASALAKKTFDIEEKRTALKRKYFRKFSGIIPPAKAARFFQIENQLNMLIDLRVAASLPLIK